ncbi:MAG TPA: hypothetical protein VIU41_08855 [Geobacteraceae bacterium]
MVVLVVLALAAALVVPRLPDSEATALRSSARNLAATLRYLGERSVTAKTGYRLHLDLAANTATVMKRLASGDEVTPDDTMLSRRILAQGITLARVQTPRLGQVTSGEVLVDFGARGLAEFLVVQLQGSHGTAYTITGYPDGGKVTVEPGKPEERL